MGCSWSSPDDVEATPETAVSERRSMNTQPSSQAISEAEPDNSEIGLIPQPSSFVFSITSTTHSQIPGANQTMDDSEFTIPLESSCASRETHSGPLQQHGAARFLAPSRSIFPAIHHRDNAAFRKSDSASQASSTRCDAEILQLVGNHRLSDLETVDRDGSASNSQPKPRKRVSFERQAAFGKTGDDGQTTVRRRPSAGADQRIYIRPGPVVPNLSPQTTRRRITPPLASLPRLSRRAENARTPL